jgi:excisionase family DNA binding protein
MSAQMEDPAVSDAYHPHGLLATSEPRLGRSVSLEQAALLLSVSRRTIYNRIREGRLRTIRTMGGSQRVLLESLHALRLHASSDAAHVPSVSHVTVPDAAPASIARDWLTTR